MIKMQEKIRQCEIEAFLHHEARLLDCNDYEAWMALFTHDGDYFIPLDPAQDDPARFDSIIYENRDLMMVRAENYAHPKSPSQEHKIRSARLITGITIAESQEDRLLVCSNFLCTIQYKSKIQYTGSYEHHLMISNGAFRIKRKRVNLIDADQPFGPIMTYL